VDGLFEQAGTLATAGADAATAGMVLVAVERGFDHAPDGLTYLVPESLSDLRAGEHVTVPLGRGNRPIPGLVVRRLSPEECRSAKSATPTLKAVIARDSRQRPLPSELLELGRWISSYYCCPLGMTLAGIVPSAVRKNVGSRVRTFVEPVAEADPPAAGRKSTKLQTSVLTALAEAAGQPIELADLLQRAGLTTPAAVRSLEKAGRVRLRHVPVEVAALTGDGGLGSLPSPPELTASQRAAVDSIGGELAAGFSQHLIFGVTGSGKTEVYLRLVERTVAAGKTAIVLVPEIALTPQTVRRVVDRFPGQTVALLHSGLSAGQRNHQWYLAATGEAKVVVGPRSAIFAPVPDGSLGLVVVDEEHDGSYKADQAPRFHGRDVAIRRAQLAGCPVVLGSATPSLESWWNATRRGSVRLHRLPQRAPGLNTPKVQVVNLAHERRAFRDARYHLIGPTLRDAMTESFAAGGQAILLLNRRGYATYLSCPDDACGWTLDCDQCDTRLVMHRMRREVGGAERTHDFVRCHHCESEQRLPVICPQCGRKVSLFGEGTQRVEEELWRLFPFLADTGRLLRLDADAVGSAVELNESLSRFGRGEAKVLLGTQMIAKGLDFPNVRVVGVINADTALALPDFRAAERTFQLVSQVAGRCGRGTAAGRAIVQTFQPDAPAIALAASHDFEEFARREIADRERFGLPPARRLARLIVRDEGESRCEEVASGLRRTLDTVVADSPRPDGTAVELRGPVPCVIGRIAGRYRRQIEVLAPSAGELVRFLTEARNRGVVQSGEQVAVDVDPVSLA
jgi:primosomal protein N' (replication factor Y)